MGIDARGVLDDHTGMSHRQKKDDTASLVLLPLIVIALGVGIFFAYTTAAIASAL